MKETHTARDFALQLGALGSLYLSLSFLLVLLFGVINIQFPDAAAGSWQFESAQSGIRFGIAALVVFFPTYLILTRIINKTRRASSDNTYLGLTKWLIYLSLLVGGGVLLGDLVAVIMTFLEGELTIRFVLKALAVLVVVGAAFGYYVLDARGVWMQREKQSVRIGIVAAGLVLAAIVIGFVSIDLPTEARERALDQQQVTDLQDMQWRIVSHLQDTGSLPSTLDQVYVTAVPTAPTGRAAYRYEITTDGFQLCATFAYPSRSDTRFSMARPLAPTNEEPLVTNTEQWEHTEGVWCFKRGVQTNSNLL